MEWNVTAVILISETGDVENVQVFKADETLAQAVIDAAKTWKFKPVVKDGAPLAVVGVVKCNFSLHDGRPDDVVPNISLATEFPKSVRVSDSVMRAMVLEQPKAAYPLGARDAGVQGTVTLRATITKEGNVTNVSVVSGEPQLTQAAIDTVQRWRYRPYLYMGRPVDVETQMQFKFSLSNGVTWL